MTDAQMITVAIALIASLGAVVYNNSRITDLRDFMNNRFNDVNRDIDDKHRLTDVKLDRILELLGDRETRIKKWSRNDPVGADLTLLRFVGDGFYA